MDWNMLGAISTALMALVIIATAIFAALQLKEISKSRKVDTFMRLFQYLQREEIREARRILIGISGKDYKDWSEKEVEAAEKACHTYDYAGVMASKKLLEKGLVAKENQDSIIKCWEAAEPMTTKYRKKRGKKFWRGFEKLYEEAKKTKTVEAVN